VQFVKSCPVVLGNHIGQISLATKLFLLFELITGMVRVKQGFQVLQVCVYVTFAVIRQRAALQ
jgi:hypothetical protein